jgi:hypothetical protein
MLSAKRGIASGSPALRVGLSSPMLAWNLAASTAYLINPATRTRTTLQLHGVPRIRFTEPPTDGRGPRLVIQPLLRQYARFTMDLKRAHADRRPVQAMG